MDSAELHWCEGLFLQPHHFQYAQRSQDARHALERSLAFPYDFGLIESQVFEEGLANKTVRFDRLATVMPGGQLLRLGDNTELESLDIAEEFDRTSGPLSIWLALPSWTADSSNVIEQQNGRAETRQFKIARRDWRDENTGDNAQSLLIRRYNARLVAGPKPPNNFTSLLVLRLTRGSGQKLGQPVLDPNFMPTCLLSRAWPALVSMTDEIAADCDSNRDVLARLMRGAGFAPDRVQVPQLFQLARLTTLSRYHARLTTIAKIPTGRPVDLYIELRALLAELQALRPDQEYEPIDDYDHESPGPAFGDIYLRIRKMLANSVTLKYREALFEFRDRILITSLQPEETAEPCEFMLAIDSPFDAKELADFVEDRARFKVMSPSTAYAAIPGIKMVEERAPVGLPVRDKRHFFRLYLNGDPQSTEMWKRIAAEKSIVLNWRELEQHQAKKVLAPRLYIVRSSQRRGP